MGRVDGGVPYLETKTHRGCSGGGSGGSDGDGTALDVAERLLFESIVNTVGSVTERLRHFS